MTNTKCKTNPFLEGCFGLLVGAGMDGTHWSTYLPEVETYIYRDTSVWNEWLCTRENIR